MDKVVQQNAANAEQSARACEDVTQQAQELGALVDELWTLVGASGDAVRTGGGHGPAAKSSKDGDLKAVR